ncbi:MAG: secretin and TonB N-terminal domain-containing protein [Burkholderiales bacterium]|nr:secretin and TonB N-terminal domain-containing protein [Burkholderiales bacterium]
MTLTRPAGAPHTRAARLTCTLLAAALLLAACATPQRQAEQLAAAGQHEAALALLRQQGAESSADIALRTAYLRQREATVTRLLAEADEARLAGQPERARAVLARIEAVAPAHPRTAAMRDALDRQQRQQRLAQQAREAFERGELDRAEAAARAVIDLEPGDAAARGLLNRITEQRADATRDALPLAAADKPVTLEFREAPLRTVFEALSRAAGVNFVFDKDVRGDTRITLYLRQTTVDEAMRLILATQQLDRKLLNDNSVLIYPNTQAKQREHQELVTRSFYLVNADVKQAQTLVRTMAKSRDIFVDERLNLLVVRDTPEVMRLVDRLIESIDLAEPEVMLDVEVMEVSSNRLLQLGLSWPSTINYGLPGSTSPITELNGGDLRAYVANPLAVARINGSLDSANLLARPKIRARNREKAKVQIGEKLPVFTTTATANVGVSSSVSYLDVGLKLEVEPQVQLDSDIVIKVALEVSSVINAVTGPDGSTAYRVGTRQTSTSLRLKDGETQILAGLINDNDRRGSAGIPGLSELPVLGTLFGVRNDTRDKQEIVLLITPRIVRNVALPALAAAPVAAGTDQQPGAASVRLRSGGVQAGQGAAGLRSGRAQPALQGGAEAGAGRAGESPQAASGEPTDPELGGPQEVTAGSGFRISVRNRGSQPLDSDLLFDGSLFDTQEPGASPGRVPLQLPAGGVRSLAFTAKADAGSGSATFQLGGQAASWAVNVRPVSRADAADAMPVAPADEPGSSSGD